MPTLTGCLVCLRRALAIAKSFSRGSASIAIAAEFFWVSVMVVFMVACGLQKIYTVLQGLRLRIWVHTIYYQPRRLQEFRRCRMVSGRTSDLFSSMKSKLECPSQAPEVEGGTVADHGSPKPNVETVLHSSPAAYGILGRPARAWQVPHVRRIKTSKLAGSRTW